MCSHTHAYIDGNAHTRAHTSTRIQACRHTGNITYTLTCIYAYAYIHAGIYTYIHAGIEAGGYACIHIHTYILPYMRARIRDQYT